MNTKNLNPEQAKAAHTINKPVLIIAGETLDVYGVGTLFFQINNPDAERRGIKPSYNKGKGQPEPLRYELTGYWSR